MKPDCSEEEGVYYCLARYSVMMGMCEDLGFTEFKFPPESNEIVVWWTKEHCEETEDRLICYSYSNFLKEHFCPVLVVETENKTEDEPENKTEDDKEDDGIA